MSSDLQALRRIEPPNKQGLAISTMPPWLSAIARRSYPIAVYVLAAVTLAFVVLVLERCRHGIDFTDEGFYLNWISNPWIYPFSVSQFGFLYHPLFRLLQDDVVLLRQANVLITFGLAYILMFVILRRGKAWRATGWGVDAALAFILALPSLFYLLQWIAAPGYNSLALQGLLLAAIGVVTNQRTTADDADRFSPASAIALGAGGWLVLLAKPSSAALLAVAALVVTLVTARRPWRTLLAAAGTSLALVVATAFVMDGSSAAFVERIQVGMTAAFEHSPAYGMGAMLALGKLSTTVIEKLLFLFVAGASGSLLVLSVVRRDLGAIAIVFSAVASACLSLLLMLQPELLALQRLRPDTAVLAAAVPLGVIAGCIYLGGLRNLASARTMRTAMVAVFLLLCPYFFAVGTNTVVAKRAMWAIVFAVAAGVLMAQVLLRPRLARLASLVIAMAALPLAVAMLVNSMEKPYRMSGPLRKQTTEIFIGPGPSTKLLVDRDTARYITELRTVLRENGRGDGTPVLDMTGTSPGALFAMGAKAVGLPWVIGGYPGSEALARRALSYVPCETLAQTWILRSPSAKRALPDTILNRAGLDGTHRVDVARILEPNGTLMQTLEKPAPSASSGTCP